jgi:hypothetical protein
MQIGKLDFWDSCQRSGGMAHLNFPRTQCNWVPGSLKNVAGKFEKGDAPLKKAAALLHPDAASLKNAAQKKHPGPGPLKNTAGKIEKGDAPLKLS